MKNVILFLTFLILISCGDDTPTIEATKPVEKVKATVVEHKPLSKSEEEVLMGLLNELNICGADSIQASDCNKENFSIIPTGKKPITESFALQIVKDVQLKGETMVAKDPRVRIYEREGGSLVLVNEFRHSVVIAQHDYGQEYQDLEVSIYHTRDQVYYHSLFTWRNKKYRFKEISRFDDGTRIRVFPANIKDSANNLMYTEFVNYGWIK